MDEELLSELWLSKTRKYVPSVNPLTSAKSKVIQERDDEIDFPLTDATAKFGPSILLLRYT